MLKELFVALIERIGELTEHLLHEARLLLLELVLMPPSCVYCFKLCANIKLCMHTPARTYSETYTTALSVFDMCFY